MNIGTFEALNGIDCQGIRTIIRVCYAMVHATSAAKHNCCISRHLYTANPDLQMPVIFTTFVNSRRTIAGGIMQPEFEVC